MKSSRVIAALALLAMATAPAVAATSDHFNAGGMFTAANWGDNGWDCPYTNYTFTVTDQTGDAWYGTNGYQGSNTTATRSSIQPGDYRNLQLSISGQIDSIQLLSEVGGVGSWFTMGVMANVGGFDQSATQYNSFMNNKSGVYVGFGRDEVGAYYGFLKNGDVAGAAKRVWFGTTPSAGNPVTFAAEINTATGQAGLSINGGAMQYVTTPLDVSMLNDAVGIEQLYHQSNSPNSADNSSSIYMSNLSISAAPVPEPASLVALASGLMGLAGLAIRRRNA